MCNHVRQDDIQYRQVRSILVHTSSWDTEHIQGVEERSAIVQSLQIEESNKEITEVGYVVYEKHANEYDK